MNGGERHAGSLRRHLGEEIFHFEPQVRDGVIDRFGGVAHYFRGGPCLRRCAGDIAQDRNHVSGTLRRARYIAGNLNGGRVLLRKGFRDSRCVFIDIAHARCRMASTAAEVESCTARM
jgi:hypothetical protein